MTPLPAMINDAIRAGGADERGPIETVAEHEPSMAMLGRYAALAAAATAVDFPCPESVQP